MFVRLMKPGASCRRHRIRAHSASITILNRSRKRAPNLRVSDRIMAFVAKLSSRFFHSISTPISKDLSKLSEFAGSVCISVSAISFIFNRREDSQAGRRGFESRLRLQAVNGDPELSPDESISSAGCTGGRCTPYS
jgi:hypothetical protein